MKTKFGAHTQTPKPLQGSGVDCAGGVGCAGLRSARADSSSATRGAGAVPAASWFAVAAFCSSLRSTRTSLGAQTPMLTCPPASMERMVYEVFRGAVEPEEAIAHTECCDLLPSNILLSGAELEFNRPGREFLLKTALSKVEENYDYIIVDTPPALNLLTVNAYVAADQLIIPMAPEVLSLLGVSQIKETIESVREYYNPHLEVLGILLNRYSARFNLNREVLELAGQIAGQLNTVVFEAKIRSSVSAAEAPAHGQSVIDYAPSSKPAQDFEALCDQVAGSRFPRVEKRGGRR